MPEVRKRTQSEAPLILTGILEGTTGRLAIIDGQIARKGDMIGDQKIEEIGKDRIVLSRDKVKRLVLLEQISTEGSTKKRVEREGPKKDAPKGVK